MSDHYFRNTSLPGRGINQHKAPAAADFCFSFFLTIPSKCPPDITGIMKEKEKMKLPLEQDLFCMGFAEEKLCLIIMCPPNTLQFFVLLLYVLEEDTYNV